MRLAVKPAEAQQVDFGAGPLITDVDKDEVLKTCLFVMTLTWSRHQYAEFMRDQSAATWPGCYRRAFEWFGGSVGWVIIDNAKCAITRACVHGPSCGQCAQAMDSGSTPARRATAKEGRRRGRRQIQRAVSCRYANSAAWPTPTPSCMNG